MTEQQQATTGRTRALMLLDLMLADRAGEADTMLATVPDHELRDTATAALAVAAVTMAQTIGAPLGRCMLRLIEEDSNG